MRIKVLPQTLINQIAAGEVVVRMASVVKELVENAIDAGATRVELAVRNGVRDVEVRDDGCGMSGEDAEMSLQRHATSKIRSVEDLMRLSTRGFRGEALPSIASVSRMEIQTREGDALSGTRLVLEGGRIQRIEAVGCPPGTRIIVRDLFYNTPARLKFLKSPVSEMNAVLTTVTRQAIAQPHIGLRVERDDNEVFELPAGQSLADRFASLLGSQLKRDLLSLAHEREGVSIQGLLAHPHDARGDRRSQYFYVNDRPFSSRPIAAALEQACRGFVMAGRFPIACVQIAVPPEDVDFNVHPTKEEVRFRDERDIAGAVFRAVQGALEGSPALVSQMQISNDAPAPAQQQTGTGAAPPPASNAMLPGFFTSPEALARRIFERKHGTATQPDWLAEADKNRRAAATPAEPRLTASRHRDGTTIAAGPGETPDNDFWSRGIDPEPLGQIAETYVVARHGEDLLLVDQHAAHERLVYLDLKRRTHHADTQPLLIPIVMDLDPAQSETMRSLIPELRALGFDITEFGPRSWSVGSIPADLPEFDPVPMLIDLIGDLEEARGTNALAELRDRILIRAACHSAIRAGQQLTPEAMRALLRQMKDECLSFTCPHGRPTIVRISKGELERQFKRVV